jgi:hypothetical protein
MAERVTRHEWPRRYNGGKYPWDEWLDGNVWRLTVGEDFTVEKAAFRTAAYAAAARRLPPGKLRIANESGGLILQFLPGDRP